MSETIFGVLAMVMTILFAMHQHQSILSEYDDMIRDEYEIMASGVALEVMEYVAGQPFDASTADDDFVLSNEYSKSKLASGPFQYGLDYAEAQVLEHFNGTETEIVFQAGDATVTFDVEVEVYYVDASNNPTPSVKQDQKEVVVRVFHDRYATFLAELRRTMSPTVNADDT